MAGCASPLPAADTGTTTMVLVGWEPDADTTVTVVGLTPVALPVRLATWAAVIVCGVPTGAALSVVRPWPTMEEVWLAVATMVDLLGVPSTPSILVLWLLLPGAGESLSMLPSAITLPKSMNCNTEHHYTNENHSIWKSNMPVLSGNKDWNWLFFTRAKNKTKYLKESVQNLFFSFLGFWEKSAREKIYVISIW